MDNAGMEQNTIHDTILSFAIDECLAHVRENLEKYSVISNELG